MGGSMSCGLREDGKVVCWGETEANKYVPTTADVIEARSGGFYHAAVRANGELLSWTYYGLAQSHGFGFRQVRVGASHFCAIRTDDTVRCFDDKKDINYKGEADPPPGTFREVTAGRRHSCGIRRDGFIECWGDNTNGQSAPPPGAF